MEPQEDTTVQEIPIKMYRTEELITISAPMPGLEAEDVMVEVTDAGTVRMRGALRGALKGVKDLLRDEWSVGPYFREVMPPAAVDGAAATVTYGNGVVVVALPISDRPVPARLGAGGQHASGRR